MKQIFAMLSALSLLFTLTACGGTETLSQPEQPQPSQEQTQGENQASPSTPAAPSPSYTPDESGNSEEKGTTDVLVAYFSATGNTENIARHIQAVLDADLYEIVPEDPYTSEDLDYSNDGCRANQEQNDANARPAIAGALETPDAYDVVFLGYPIWWGQAPKILYTFLESYDFGTATIIPFCTSSSSGIGSSADNLQPLTENVQWLPGQRFSGNESEDTVAAWVNGLQLPQASGEIQLLLTFASGEAVIALDDNATTRDFIAMLPATLTFEDYAGSEKISYLDRDLSTADAPASYDPQVGDVTLYKPWGNLAIFYGEAGSSSGLVFMGRMISGLELFAGMDGAFEVSISVVA